MILPVLGRVKRPSYVLVPIIPMAMFVVQLKLTRVVQTGLGCIAARGKCTFALETDLAGLHGTMSFEEFRVAVAAAAAASSSSSTATTSSPSSGGGPISLHTIVAVVGLVGVVVWGAPLCGVTLQLTEVFQRARLDAAVITQCDQDGLGQGLWSGDETIHRGWGRTYRLGLGRTRVVVSVIEVARVRVTNLKGMKIRHMPELVGHKCSTMCEMNAYGKVQSMVIVG